MVAPTSRATLSTRITTAVTMRATVKIFCSRATLPLQKRVVRLHAFSLIGIQNRMATTHSQKWSKIAACETKSNFTSAKPNREERKIFNSPKSTK